MAAPQQFADIVQTHIGGQWFGLSKTLYQQWMTERAARLNTLELIKSCQDGEVDLMSVKVNDDGFEVMPPKPKPEPIATTNDAPTQTTVSKPRARARK